MVGIQRKKVDKCNKKNIFDLVTREDKINLGKEITSIPRKQVFCLKNVLTLDYSFSFFFFPKLVKVTLTIKTRKDTVHSVIFCDKKPKNMTGLAHEIVVNEFKAPKRWWGKLTEKTRFYQ